MIGVFTIRKYQQISFTLIKCIAAFCIVIVFFTGSNASAQTWPTDTIHVQINTNNPAFPFPQFLEYQSGKSLAANNAVGVTHADMEKAMCEAYQIMMHRALKVPGKILNGVQYMQFNNNTVPQNYGTFVSEGDGYALLAAAYFADKPTFDGLWAWVHDNRLSAVTKYYDCLPLRAGYPYGAGFAGWQCTDADGVGATSINSAGDGDVDIAMALLIAAKQWPTGGINDGCGNLHTYKAEALKMIKVMVDTLYYSKDPFGNQAGNKGYLSGIVGIDGYIKSGNTWGEVTNWRYTAANTTYPWALIKPDPIQVNSPYVDYNAPAYFEEFADFLATNGGTAWEISQCRRCAASADWIIGQMYAKGFIASAGNHTVSDNGATTTFGPYSAGEDFRLAWRTILNYVWHGNPTTTWNPVTHQIVASANTFEYDMALRHKEFLKFPNALPSTSANAFCSKLGASPDPGQPNWKGVAQIKQQYATNGTVLANYGVNWMAGTGMSAAVASNDIDLTAELYRQCELSWDDQSGSAKVTPAAARYINSTPKYFHGWFRTLGMLTASGNLHAPEDMVAAANMKVYMDVDKTFAYEGDLVNYEVSYRNYGSVDATGVNITTIVDPSYQIVSAVGGAISGNTITWSIGTVPGFVTNGLAATKGIRTFVVRVKPISIATVVCLTSTITSGNAPIWTSNEYPNNATYTMERNCVDLLKDRVLAIEKTTDRSIVNSGDIVNFTLNFENKTGSNLWLNGGRDRVILSYANFIDPNNPSATSFYQFYRIWHSAQEAYIDLGNYRVSYFMNDGAAIGKYNATTNPTGWDTYVDNQNDLDKYGYNPLTLPVNQQLNFTYQKIPWGSDVNGAWNQRVITQFAHVLSAPSTHIFDKLDSEYLIHKGVVGPGFTRTRFESKPSSALKPRIADDWSYDPTAASGNLDGQGYYFFPVTPAYTNFNSAPKFAPVAVTNYSKDACGGPVQNFAKVLFEEFDGYTWRRVAGNGPLPGRETYNVVVTDSIPIELAWSAFIDDNAVGITATYTALTGNPKFSGYVKWSIPVMLTGETGNLSYKTIAKSPCAEKTFINAGWIWSDVDSPDSSAVNLRLTCNPVPPTAPIETSLVKTADKTNVVVGDVINYTLTFTNKDGSTASWAGASTVATDWQTLGTGVTIPKLNTAVISLDQNGGNNAPGANGYSFGPKKAHGVNGWMEATIAATNSSNISFLYRYQSPTQNIRLEVSPNIGGNNNIAFYLYQNGSTTPFVSLTGLAFPGSSSAIKIRTELLNDKLYIWVNDFSGAPLKVISGITQLGAGFAGIFGNGSQQALSAYTAHFDSAFDLVISDAVPAQLNNITNYSTAVLTGSNLTWPTIPGPILATAPPIVKTFTATVNTCTDFITNIGKASVYGVTNIQSQYVVICGASTPPCTKPTITSSATGSVCSGVAQSYAITSSLPSTYTWTRAVVAGISNLVGSGTTATITETLTNTTAAAIVVQYVIIPTSTTGACVGNPFNYNVTVNPLPTVSGTLTVCQGLTTQLTGSATAGTAPAWVSGTPAVATVDNTGLVTGVSAGTSVITYTNSNGCKITATVTINGLPTITGTLNVCIGSTTQLTGSATAGTSPAWVSASPLIATVDNTGLVSCIAAGTSVITYTNSNGCKQTATVTVNPIPTISGTLTVCIGSTTTLTGSGTPAAAAWSSASPLIATVTNAGVVTGVAAGISVITYTDNKGCSKTATVTVNPLPTITGTLTVCQGLTTQLTGSATAGTAPAWVSGTPAVATVDNTGLVTGVSAGTSVITYTNSNGCTQTATVTVSGTLTISGTLSVCIGSTTTLTGSGTPGSTAWTSAGPSVATITNAGVVTGVSAGTSVITYTTSAGCIKTATVTVNPKPTVTSLATGTTCTGVALNYTITSNIPSSYTWTRASVAGVTPATGSGSTNPITETLTSAATASVTYVITPTSTTGSCPGTPFNYVVTISGTAVPTVAINQTPSGSICAGTSVTFKANQTNGGNPVFKWTSSVNGLLAPTNDTYVSPSGAGGLVNGEIITVELTSDLGCANPKTATDSKTMVVNAVPTPSVSLSANKSTLCPSDNILYTAVPTQGGSNPSYVWKNNGAVIAGQTTATYSTTGTALGTPNSITVEMLSNATCAPTTPAVSTPVVVTVNPLLVPSVGISAATTPATAPTTICTNGSVTFTAAPTNPGTTPSYEWFINNVSKQVSPSTTFTTTELTASSDVIKVVLTSNALCVSPATAQASMSIIVNPGITAGTIGTAQSVCYNGIAATLTELTASSAVTPTYTWEEATLAAPSVFGPVTGGTPSNGGKDFTPPNLTSGMYYRRVVTDASAPAPCNISRSNSVLITVRPQLVAGVIVADETICSGAVPLTMTETTAPTGGTGSYTYQWESDAAVINTFAPIGAATNSSYTSGAITRITQFRRVETSGSCGSVTSNVVIKDISAPEAYTVSINDPGVTCTGPGSSITFTATALASTPVTGTLSYEWFMNSTSVGTGPTYVYSPVVIGDDNKVVKVVVKTTNGCSTAPWTSNLVTLDIVDASTPTVTITALNNPNCAGLMSTFTLTSTGGGNLPTYQWYVDPVGPTGPTAVGTGGITYSTSTLANGDQVYAELTSSLSCLIGTNPFKSNVVTMIIKPIPTPSITEGDQTICSPNTFTFHGNVTAGNTYEWRNGTTVVGTGTDFTATQSGTYTLFEDNGTCNSTSQPVTLTIVQTPIANAGTDIYLKQGDAGSLNGSGGAVYSWSPATYLNNASISNPSFTATQTITYTLTVSDASNTCSTTDDVNVFVVKPIVVPNVITVNGDGTNDDWEIENIEGYPNVIIEIYNRWGNLVWKTEGYPKNWDGTNFRNGQVLPDGTYFYIINLHSQVYDEPLTGWVQIVK